MTTRAWQAGDLVERKAEAQAEQPAPTEYTPGQAVEVDGDRAIYACADVNNPGRHCYRHYISGPLLECGEADIRPAPEQPEPDLAQQVLTALRVPGARPMQAIRTACDVQSADGAVTPEGACYVNGYNAGRDSMLRALLTGLGCGK